MELFTSSFYFCAERGFSSRRVTCVRAASRCLFLPCLLPRRELKVQFRALEFSTLLEKTRRGLATTSPWRVRGAHPSWLPWVSPPGLRGGARRGWVARSPTTLFPFPLTHTHLSSTTQSRALPRRARLFSFCSSRGFSRSCTSPPPAPPIEG